MWYDELLEAIAEVALKAADEIKLQDEETKRIHKELLKKRID